MKKKYSIAEIKNQYNEEKKTIEKKTDFFMYLIYRPISFYITLIPLKLNISANTISLISLFISLLLPVVAALKSEHSYLYIALLSFFYFILDCVDGNIARIKQKTNPLGRYLDSFVGKLFWISLYMSTGFLTLSIEKVFFRNYGIIIGLLAGTLYIFSRESRAYVKINFPDKFPKYFIDKISPLNVFLSSVELAPLLLVILGYFNSLQLLLIYFFIHSILFFVGSETMIFSRLRKLR